jgi:gluconate kinase
MIHDPPKGEVALVYFSAGPDECVERVQSRQGHETIPQGKGAGIVRRVTKQLEPPSDHEIRNLFGTVKVVRTFDDANQLLREWGVTDTPHSAA